MNAEKYDRQAWWWDENNDIKADLYLNLVYDSQDLDELELNYGRTKEHYSENGHEHLLDELDDAYEAARSEIEEINRQNRIRTRTGRPLVKRPYKRWLSRRLPSVQSMRHSMRKIQRKISLNRARKLLGDYRR